MLSTVLTSWSISDIDPHINKGGGLKNPDSRMKIVLPPGEALVVQFRGSQKLLLVETSSTRASVYTADPHPHLKPPEKIYDKKFTINLVPELE